MTVTKTRKGSERKHKISVYERPEKLDPVRRARIFKQQVEYDVAQIDSSAPDPEKYTVLLPPFCKAAEEEPEPHGCDQAMCPLAVKGWYVTEQKHRHYVEIR
jgi:hypothetical protein